MKLIKNKIAGLGAILLALSLGACNDYLDITPPSSISPELYFMSADQLASYTINYYKGSDTQGGQWSNAFPHHGIGGSSYETFLDGDQGTDNESGTNNRFFDGDSKYQVGSGGGDWSFGYLNNINYYLNEVVPRYEAGQISGSDVAVRHYIG
ncbi:MAG: RagB/SusD family nutrient uptake outer membrane protein, partial [Muribaculaceae bacterium]|nr:RagB/SusD family nutrient uptake outer membrane protein [Muribaculaceae bacterium]